MKTEFEVFHHSLKRPREVIARRVADGPLTIAPGSRLGPYEVEPRLSQPRALDAAGRPRFDLFLFIVRGPVVPSSQLETGTRMLLDSPE